MRNVYLPPAEPETLHWSPLPRRETGDAKLACLRLPERLKWRVVSIPT